MLPGIELTAAQRSGADQLVGSLARVGAELAFGLPGVHNLAIWDAASAVPLRLVGVRHEQAAVYAADGYARATGRLGIAFTTTGPGAANALAATGEAWASSSPVLVIATDIPSTLRRGGSCRGVLHESRDQAGMFAPVVKMVFRARSAEEVGDLVVEAAHMALAAPAGPVYLEVPTDFLEARISGPLPEIPPRFSGGTRVDEKALSEALALLADAERPLIWVGGGAVRADAGEAVGRLSAFLGAPVIETYAARGLLSREHPGKVTVTPHAKEIGDLWDEADVTVVIGSDLDGMMTQNWQMPTPRVLIAINTDSADARKNYPVDVLLEGDARNATTELVEALVARGQARAPWGDLDSRERRFVARLAVEEPEESRYLQTLRESVDDETIVFADMCIPGYWLAAFHPRGVPRSLSYPVGWGTLGFAFPASIGAALGQSRRVLCVCGDGGFLFACGELAVLKQEDVPLTVVIANDRGYGMLRYEQQLDGRPLSGVDLVTPDFVRLAESFGIRAERVSGIGPDFAAALTSHLNDPSPSVLVADVALRPPPNTSPRWYRRRVAELAQA